MLTYTSWPLHSGWRFNDGGAPSLVAPSARGNRWLGGEAGQSSGAHLSSAHFLSIRCSAELPHDGLSCSRSSSTACFGARTDSARIHQFSAWHCFPWSTSLCQVVAFSRAFLKATLRLATGSMAPKPQQLCASQHQLFPTLMHDAFEHWCPHETRLKILALLPIPAKGAVITPQQTHFIGSGFLFFFPLFKRALCCCFHSKQPHLIKVKPTGWTTCREREEKKMMQNFGPALGEEQLQQSVPKVRYHENYVSLPPSPKYLIQGRRGRTRSPLSSHATSNHIHSAFLFN